MKHRLVVFDHDDTLVNSTPMIHYPSFVEVLKELRPRMAVTMDEFLSYSFEPGFVEMCHGIFGFTDDEMEFEYDCWLKYVKGIVPRAFKEVKPLLERLRTAGVRTAVVSHSREENILRDFRVNGLPLPDDIYGWVPEKEKRKPSPWPLERLIEKYSLAPGEIIVLDDLRPGLVMADSAGADFAAAGWGYDVPAVRSAMRACCKEGMYFTDIASFEEFLFNA